MRRYVGALALVTAVAACDCVGDVSVRPDATEARAEALPPPALPEPDGCANGVAQLRPDVQRGVCYAHNYQDSGGRGYGTRTSGQSHAELAALGVEWVSLTPFAFMSGVTDERVRLIGDHPAGETDEVMARELALCGARELRVLLKPHIWIRGGAYRGDIELGTDEAWKRWFDSYDRFVLHYARMAAEHGVEVLAVGVELDQTTQRFEHRWRELLARVREVYEGQLVYAANWDTAIEVPFWDAVDYVGVQFYPPLADEAGAGDDAIRRRLAAHLDRLASISEQAGRPVLLTEVGYRSAEGAELRPHAWPERDVAPGVDHAIQARAYRLLLEGFAGRDWLAGIYFWKWFTDPGTNEEGPAGFSPRGKPAEAVLRAAYRGCPPSG